MARIAIVTSHPPFTEGGHLVIARGLLAAVRAAGHDADLICTPQNRFGRQAAAYVATWLTDVGESDGRRVDQVISLRYPSFAVRHPRHVCWLNHTMREYYDLWPQFRARLSWKNRLKEGVRRRLVHAADRRLLAPGRVTVFAQSHTVAARLRDTLGISSAVLHPPPPVRPYRCDTFGDEFLVVSRLTPLKRVDLVIRALAEPAAAALTCRVAGEGEALPALQALAATLGVAGRVRFLGRVTEEALVDAYARCRAVVFVPQGEDYGFVAAEAFASSKPVVTSDDSGGPTDLVQDHENGLIVAATPAAVAAAMRQLADDPGLAASMGQRAAAFSASMRWPQVVERLVVV
jgi:glycosyltransferase involved in cell wall biosynthesis